MARLQKDDRELLDLIVRAFIAAIACIGIGLSLYLLAEHYRDTGGSFCDINATLSCDVVNKSQYAELFGIPISLLGAFYYLGILLFALLPHLLLRILRIDRELLQFGFLGGGVIGVLFSAYLTGVEAFLLHVFCPLCVISAILTVILLFIGVIEYRRVLEG